jgi:outer membrane receptor protein involved in Fe transport
LRRILYAAASLAVLATAEGARAAEPAPAPSASVSEVVVTARRLDAARQTVEPALGATTYSLPEKLVNNLPGGANIQLNQVILQAPGVTQDSFGQLHIRGDHNGIQYRLNNVILPEGLSVFGQTLSPRLAANIDLVTGALPAQYGLRTAGIINITTKSGFENGGEVSIYGGSHDEIEPSIEYGGSWGPNSLFVSGSYLHTGVGIESVDGSKDPLHDDSDQYQGFAYFDRVIGDNSRLSFIVGTSQDTFEIPNPRGLHSATDGTGLAVNGLTDFVSNDLDERQREGTTYAIASYLYSGEHSAVQASLFSRYSTLVFTPDPSGDLMFDGIAQSARKSDTSAGLQLEGKYELGQAHTLRAGVIVEGDRAVSKTSSDVFFVCPAPNAQIDCTGAQVSDVPSTVIDNGAKTSWTYSAFLQDEWKLLSDLTMNYGLRFDQLESYRSEHQFSPRVNLVWTPVRGLTAHAGYARYFTPPPYELVANETIAKFVNTTAPPLNGQDVTPFAMRTDYFDVGAQQKLGGLTLGVDAYYRRDHDLLDEGQFGAPIILTPFNYQTGYARGVELSANYTRGPLTAYANLAFEKAQGRNIISSQFNFDPSELAYIAGHYIFLDHNQSVTASAGVSYQWRRTHFDVDLIYGSGLRRDGAVPNGDHVPGYVQVNLALAQEVHPAGLGKLTLRLDVINLLDEAYQIRDGTGVGVGAPQWGPRRGVFAGISKAF